MQNRDVINTLSMSEMSPHQVECYGEMISQMIGGTGLFFEQNQDNRSVGLIDCKSFLPRYFIRGRTIDPAPFPLSQGKVGLWSNRGFPFPYRPATRRVIFIGCESGMVHGRQDRHA